jgi:hypothetical protein
MWRQTPAKDWRDPGDTLFKCIDSLAGKHGFLRFSQSKEEELN